MLVWKTEKGKLVTTSGRLRAVMEKVDDMWEGSIFDGEARLSKTRGAKDSGVASVVLDRMDRMNLEVPGECGSCAGPTYSFRGGPKRCLTRGCKQYKKKVG